MAPKMLSEVIISYLPTTPIASAAATTTDVDKNNCRKIYHSDFFPCNPALDFFFHVVPDTPALELIHLVQLSWSYDPLLTLKLICNLQGVRGSDSRKSVEKGSDTGKRSEEVSEEFPVLCRGGRGFGLMGGRGRGFGLMEEEEDDDDENKGGERSEEEKEKIRVLRPKRKNERTKKILSIARGLFPKEEFDEYRGMEEGYYAFKVRDRLRKEVLVPLRKALELPEVYICAKEWDALPYNRVPSVAMNLYKSLFYKHDREKFEGYLEKVKSGKVTIAAGALLPHEIIASLKRDKNGGEVAELHWKRMVDDLAKKGSFLTLSEKPWKGKLITFSNDPQFHRIKGRTLIKKCSFVKNMDRGFSTDLQKVLDRILKVAVKAKLPQEQMIKRLFIFSDMEFNEASGRKPLSYGIHGKEPNNDVISWETDYMALRGYSSTEPGVALVSGYSKNLITLFLEEGGVLNPEGVMLAAVAKPEYDAVVVYD
uniref:Uncharacterized protein n=1 Tax=Chenopodium quinoa TaxID=63459 RepID=A0A803KSW1_CHEQI